ncbi:hypothetical protein B7463_g6559, partial [Scytalidium lignicola]
MAFARPSTLPDTVGNSAEGIAALLNLQHVPSASTPHPQNSEQAQLLHRPSYSEISIRSPVSIQAGNSPAPNTAFPNIERRTWYEAVASANNSQGGLPSSSMLAPAPFSSTSPTDGDVWDLNLNQQIPGWLVRDDFDLSALNSVTIPSSIDWHDFPNSLPELNPPSADTIEVDFSANINADRREDIVQCHWFTYLVPEESGHITPDALPEQTQVDEQYREKLSRQLQQRVLNEPLPSTDFLWESYMVRGRAEALAMTQAALIGQTFGMLSGSPRHLAIVQTFHGTVIAWARRQKMFEQKSAPVEIASTSEADLDKAWKNWVSVEEKLRVTVGLRIHDCELAEIFMAEPFLRNSQSQLPNIANDDLWTAPTASKWASTIKGRGYQSTTLSPEGTRYTRSSQLTRSIEKESSITNWLAVYANLEGLATTVIEHRSSNSLDKIASEIQESLLNLYDTHLRTIKIDLLSLQALWHSVFISLFCDINRLEVAAGREGYERAKEEQEYANEWASSRNGHRCALHAALILKQLESMSIGLEPAIHVPRLLFRASLVWYTYTRLGQDNESGSPTHLDFPELTKLGIEGRKLLFEANGYKFTRPATAESSTLCCLVDLLKRGGHWGISRKMTSLLTMLIYGSLDVDGNMMG